MPEFRILGLKEQHKIPLKIACMKLTVADCIINIKGRIVDKDKFLNYQDLFPFHEEKKFYVPRVYHRFYQSIMGPDL